MVLVLVLVLVLVGCVRAATAFGPSPAAPPNIMLLAVDDLRAEFGHSFGNAAVQTPNIDKLASRSGAVAFRRAYAQFSHCVVSRASILSGRRPAYTKAKTGNPFGFGGCARGDGNFTTLPTYFREHGYNTAGSGKVFHPDTCDGAAAGEDTFAWSLTPYYHAPCFQWGSLPCRSSKAEQGTGCGVPSWIANDTATDAQTPDGMIATSAIQQMGQLVSLRNTTGKPWFLAVGFHKPHLPHFAPKRYWDLYANISIPAPVPPSVPTHSDTLVWLNEGGTHELWEYDDITQKWPNKYNDANFSLPRIIVAQQQLAYYAVVSFMDAQVGRVMMALDRLHQTDATVVVLFSDHGWHLGEQHHWAKCTLFEHGLHIPLLFVVPNVTAKHGRVPLPMIHTTALAEAVAIYPTLVDLAGLPPLARCPNATAATTAATSSPDNATTAATSSPDNAHTAEERHGLTGVGVKECTDAGSLGPVIRAHTMQEVAEVAPQQLHHGRRHQSGRVALSQWHGSTAAGYSMRTDRYRYTEWVVPTPNASVPAWHTVLARELYDHDHDPLESTNQAQNSSMKLVIAELSQQLHAAR